MTDQLFTAIRESHEERALVAMAEFSLRRADSLGFRNERARDAMIDYITMHRLAAICHQQEVDRLEAIELQKQQDWLDDQQMYSQLRNGG